MIKWILNYYIGGQFDTTIKISAWGGGDQNNQHFLNNLIVFLIIIIGGQWYTHLTGIDYSSAAVELAKQVAIKEKAKVKFLVSLWLCA